MVQRYENGQNLGNLNFMTKILRVNLAFCSGVEISWKTFFFSCFNYLLKYKLLPKHRSDLMNEGSVREWIRF